LATMPFVQTRHRMNADTDRMANPTSELVMKMPGVILPPLTLNCPLPSEIDNSINSASW
jgi:hypothetical protein